VGENERLIITKKKEIGIKFFPANVIDKKRMN